MLPQLTAVAVRMGGAQRLAGRGEARGRSRVSGARMRREMAELELYFGPGLPEWCPRVRLRGRGSADGTVWRVGQGAGERNLLERKGTLYNNSRLRRARNRIALL